MPKPFYSKAMWAGLSFVLSLLGALALYPRQMEMGEVIFLIPPPFSAALPAGIMYTLLLIVLYEAAIQIRWARGKIKQPTAAAGFVRLEKLYATFAFLLFLVCVWLELHLENLHTLYWKLEPVFLCVWLVGLAIEVAGSLCVRSPWAFMRYLYIGILGCVSAFALYWSTPGAVLCPAATFFAENLQPLYVAAVVAVMAARNHCLGRNGR